MQKQEAKEKHDQVLLNKAPYSFEAEQSVLGGLMLDNTAFELIAEMLVPEDFYRVDHRIIYSSIVELVEQGQPFDVITLMENLEEKGMLEQVGGLAYLGTLASNIPSVANIQAYARIVEDRSALRQVITIGKEILEMGYAPDGRTGAEVLEEAERKIFKIADSRRQQETSRSFRETLLGAVDTVDKHYMSDTVITGLPTGFTDLDGKTHGLQDSELIILAGRPSMGKTTLAMNIVESTLLNTDKRVVVFSLGTPAETLTMRMLSSLGRVDLGKLRTGQLDEDDWARLTSTVEILADVKLHIEDDFHVTPAVIRARTRRIAREHGEIGLVVDYLQLMHLKGGTENRTNEISEISRSLKALARELRCPVIALSQLNRSLEQRPNKRPINSDLRESGAIEQDADLILFVYRDEVYFPETKYPGMAEVIIGKQRNGSIGTVFLDFRGRYTRFDNSFPGKYDFED